MPSISIILPCYNEEENIATTVASVLVWFDRTNADGEIIVVDDGSQDHSAAVVARIAKQDPRVHLIRHEENQGYGAAIRTGFDAATKDAMAFMDSDRQFSIESVDLLLPHLSEHTPIVAGIREHRADPWKRHLTGWLYSELTRWVLHVKMRDVNCGLKLFRRDIWPRIRPRYATGALFNAEVFLRVQRQNIPFAEIPVPHYPRQAGNPTGLRPAVVLRMFKELRALKQSQQQENDTVAFAYPQAATVRED